MSTSRTSSDQVMSNTVYHLPSFQLPQMWKNTVCRCTIPHPWSSMLVCPRVSVLAVRNQFRFSDLYPSYYPWYLWVLNEIRLRLLLVALVGKHLPWPRWGLHLPHPRVIWNPLRKFKSSGWNPNKTHATFTTILTIPLGLGVLARSNLAPNLLSAQWPSSLGRDCANKTLGKGCHNMISPWCWQTWSRQWCYITNKLHTHMYVYIYIVFICTHDIHDNNIWLTNRWHLVTMANLRYPAQF